MLLAARQNWWGSTSPTAVFKSLKKTGTTSQAFYCNPSSMPVNKTLTMWFRYANVTTERIARSKCIVKYGNASNGVGVGIHTSSVNPGSFDMLLEARCWRTISSLDQFNNWNHIAVIVKPSNAYSRTVYLNGNVFVGSSGYSAYTPSGNFSLCGRPRDDIMDADVEVCRVCMFDSELTSEQITADYNLGGVAPSMSSLIHYWDGTVENEKVKDLVGDWHLTMSAGCTIEDENPWSDS